jgi:hypothetical protein
MGPGGNLEYDESSRRQRSNPGGVRGTSPKDGELRGRLGGSRLRVALRGRRVLLCHEPVVPARAFEVERVFREAVVDLCGNQMWDAPNLTHWLISTQASTYCHRTSARPTATSGGSDPSAMGWKTRSASDTGSASSSGGSKSTSPTATRNDAAKR